MLILAFFVFLCSNFLFIKSEDNGVKNVLAIHVDPGHNCTMSDGDTFEEGNITLVVTAMKHLNYGWWRVTRDNNTKDLYDDIKTKGNKTKEDEPKLTIQTAVINKAMEGIWEFEFFMLQGVKVSNQIYQKEYNGILYVVAVCRKNVTIVPSTSGMGFGFGAKKNIIIVALCLIAILFAIIVAQAAYIFFLKAKARKLITLNTHNNLSQRKESEPDDTARYCSNPRPKVMKQSSPVNDDYRDSVIYEDPHLEVISNQRSPMQPPQAPSINTMPRTPRPDHNMKIGPQAMQPSARNSPARNPMSEIQRHIQDRELNLANRPPLPLPNQGHPNLLNAPQIIAQIEPHSRFSEEVYEEMETEYNTYEPPPIINTTPHRQAGPTKKIPTGNLLGEQPNTLNLRQLNKPAVTPKPQPPQHLRSNTLSPAKEIEQAFRKRNETMPKPNLTPMQQELAMRRRPTGGPPANELEEVLRRRNNVMPVPVQSIPDPSSRGPPMMKPPPLAKPPMPQPVQEEIYYNENQASSDEEWTYEPLKPLNGYDENIYNNI